MALFDLGPGGEQLLTLGPALSDSEVGAMVGMGGSPFPGFSQDILQGHGARGHGEVPVLTPDGDTECLRGWVALGVSQAAVAPRVPKVP